MKSDSDAKKPALLRTGGLVGGFLVALLPGCDLHWLLAVHGPHRRKHGAIQFALAEFRRLDFKRNGTDGFAHCVHDDDGTIHEILVHPSRVCGFGQIFADLL